MEKKVGEEAAENAKFLKKKLHILIQLQKKLKHNTLMEKFLNLKLLQSQCKKHMIKIFMINIKKKYNQQLEILFLKKEQTLLSLLKTNQGGNADTFQQVVDARIAPILENLEPKFSQVIETYAKGESQSHWYQVFDERTRQDIEKLENLSYDVDLKEKLQNVETAFINEADNTKELEDDLKNFIET